MLNRVKLGFFCIVNIVFVSLLCFATAALIAGMVALLIVLRALPFIIVTCIFLTLAPLFDINMTYAQIIAAAVAVVLFTRLVTRQPII